MSRTKWLFVPAICALAVAAGTPALALNPQPLPPGLKQSTFSRGSNHVQIYCASGQHFPKFTLSRHPR